MKYVLKILALLLVSNFLFSQVPDYNFMIEPTELMSSYFDYMPGGYNNIPIQIQPEVSFPNNYPAGGIYIAYQAKETSFSERFVYFSYINSLGEIVSTDLISPGNYRQGYPGIDIDPVSCDPICCWHTEVDQSYHDCHITADIFHNSGFSGNWTDEFTIIDNPETGFPFTGFDDDEFVWPAVYISNSSPLGEDYRRIYVSANNNTDSHGELPYPCENVLLCYADFLSSELDDLSTLDWTYRTIEQMDDWCNEGSYQRPHKAFIVHENIVVYAGYLNTYENQSSEVFVLINENYGEGPFEYYSYPAVSYYSAMYSRHMNLVFRDDYSKVSFVGVRGSYTPRLISFDLNTHEFSFQDLFVSSLPFTYYEDFFHFNNFKIVETGNRLVAVWQDCQNALYASQGVEGYEEWEDVVEIVICISNDSGETWSDPIFLNPIETPELEDLKSNYAYPGDVIEDLGNDHGKLHLFFYSDHSFGCYIHGYGQDLGGELMYTALDIDFGSITSSENFEFSQVQIALSNYPNPFQTTTTISFSVTQTSRFVTLDIYNIKGQKVKTLDILECSNRVAAASTQLMHSIDWNGKDEFGKPVNSGVYFYKLTSGKNSAVKKMILMR